MSDRMVCPYCGGWIYLENDRNGSCDTCDTKFVEGRIVFEDRTITLLKAAKELLIKQREAGILRDHPFTVHYDDADCDGYCLIDDITAEIDAPDPKPQGSSVQEHIELKSKPKEIEPKEKILPGLETGGGFMIPLAPVDKNNRPFVFCSKCNFGKYADESELPALCPICQTQMQRQDS